MKKSLVHSIKFNYKFRLKILLFIYILNGLIFQGCDYFFPPLKSEKISSEEAAAFIEKHKNDKEIVILDVGTKMEFDSLSIENAVNLDFTLPDFPDLAGKMDKDKRYLIVDLTGKKSALALELMKEEKFTKVHYIIGGLKDWQSKNLPFIKKKK